MPYRHAWIWCLAIIALTAVAFWPGYFSQLREAKVTSHVHAVTATLWVLLVAAHRWTGGGRTEQGHPPHACDRVMMKYRLLWYAGLVLNIPLLPAYPLMVQYTDWSLATVNTLLHAWLTMAWGMQGIALRHFCLALGGDGRKQVKA